MNWFQKNFKTIIYLAFLIPILTVAFVSISHVTAWYGITNPFSWAIYLSIGIEIAALSALAAISANMGRVVYVPLGIVTFIQFLGNIFFAYQYIQIDSKIFMDWVEMTDPIVSYLGVESGNLISHKRFLALFAGGMLPLISLSFLHMLVKFEEEEKKKKPSPAVELDIDELSKQAGRNYQRKIYPNRRGFRKT
jgi:phosphoglycerol transferase MdoB-like AlkP superfamily enzyme